jgi:hypothetical protein
MTTTGAKAPTNAKTAPPSAPTAQQDAKIASYVRANAPHIVAGLIAVASRMSEARDWSGMNEYQTMAGKLSDLCGLKAATAAPPAANTATMAAAAGR